MKCRVRELAQQDIPLVAEYWQSRSDEQLLGMGVDLSKKPTSSSLTEMLREQLCLSVRQRQTYCLIWEIDGVPSGHCNINKIQPEKEAYMHLHLWQPGHRKKGLGSEFVRKSLCFFFDKFDLQILYCEPHAFNEAPNKTLAHVGFRFVKQYVTVPGPINFEQAVCLWQFSREDYFRQLG